MTDRPSSSGTGIPRAPLHHKECHLDNEQAVSFGLPPSSDQRANHANRAGERASP